MRAVAPLLFVALSSAPVFASSFLGHLRSTGHRGAADGQDATVAGGKTSATNSLAEVIELLGTMMKEFNEADKQDSDNWEDYSEWSDEAEVDKNSFIQKQKALVMSLTSKMNANKQLVQKLTADLTKLVDDIADSRASIKDLVQMRKEEHATFEASLTDVTKTITAVGKATEILQGHYATGGGAALAEIRRRVQLALTMYSGVRKTKKDMDALASLLQDGRRTPDYLSVDGDKYNTYEKQGGGGGVLGMLDDLRSQLEGQKQELISNESDAQRQFDETKAAKTSELKGFVAQQDEKTQKKENAKATISTCVTGMDEASTAISEGQTYLTELLADRAKFHKQKDLRTQMRKEEQAATQAALDALQAVSAGATATVEGGASFLQMASAAPARVARLQKVLRKLVPLAKELKSLALVQTVTKSLQDFDAGSSFAPVVKLLNDLVTRLETEAGAETSQHEWCENEKDSSVKARDEREAEIKNLKSTIESQTTLIAQLKSEIVFMESEIERVNDETKTAVKIRKEEKELFTSSKADHEEVITAIKTALGALGGQYGFLQLQQQRTVVVKHGAVAHLRSAGGRGHAKETPFSDYASGDASAGSASEMLEDLEARYEAALASLIKDESESQKAHDELLVTNKLFVETTTAEKNAKMKQRRATLQDLGDDKDEMKTNLLELHEVSKYLMDLRPSCDDIRSTYEERKKRREAEIAALKEALEVISDPSAMGF